MAQIHLTGNIVRTPELRFTPSGQAVTNFSIAENRRYQDSSGEWQESTSFFDVVAWADLAENVAQSLHQGDRATITGRIEQRSWETPEGDKHSKLEVTATDVAASVRFATVTVAKVDRTHAE
ncbi:MAG: single-stranded DNA-binding protein [Acidimicrobiales bacterium]